MKIFICCSKHFYDRIPPIKARLEEKGHIITLPNSYDNPQKEQEMYHESKESHVKWKADMFRLSEQRIKNNDAILVLNFEKNGQQDYIGGATFIEMYKAFELRRKIFLYNSIPQGMLRDEIESFDPLLIEGDLEKIVEDNVNAAHC